MSRENPLVSTTRENGFDLATIANIAKNFNEAAGVNETIRALIGAAAFPGGTTESASANTARVIELTREGRCEDAFNAIYAADAPPPDEAA